MQGVRFHLSQMKRRVPPGLPASRRALGKQPTPPGLPALLSNQTRCRGGTGLGTSAWVQETSPRVSRVPQGPAPDMSPFRLSRGLHSCYVRVTSPALEISGIECLKACVYCSLALGRNLPFLSMLLPLENGDYCEH